MLGAVLVGRRRARRGLFVLQCKYLTRARRGCSIDKTVSGDD